MRDWQERIRSPPPRIAPLLALAAIVCVVWPLSAQSADAGTLMGRVNASSTGDAVVGAEVLVEESDRRTTTGEDGLFRFENLPAGPHDLVVTYLGIRSREISFDLPPGGSDDLSLVVDLTIIPVAELHVEISRTHSVGKLVGFFRRSERGAGVFITREEIAERRPNRPTDMLRRVPGLSIGASRFGSAPVSMGRREGCIPQYFVDGTRAPRFNIDDLHPSDIAGIEIYRGNSEVPIEFKSGDRCGAIIIWTRDPGRR